MAKQVVNQRETQVATQDGVGKQFIRTLTVDDTCLPTPDELTAYQKVDPNIVTFLLEVSKKEQEHRHKVEEEKIDLIKKSDSRMGCMNWWGMFFAFLSIVVMTGLAGYALYLDKPWFAGIMGASTLISVVSIFVTGGKEIPLPRSKDLS